MSFVPLTLELTRAAASLGRDPLEAEMVEGSNLAEMALRGPGFAMLEDGYLMGAGGLMPHWPGRVEAWLIVTRFARPRHVVAGARHARDFIARRQRHPAFRRVEAYCRADRPWSLRFGGTLGLALEARLTAWYPNGADAFLFANVAELT